jgi:hypothetical protein
MLIYYRDCNEAGLCCYLVIHIGNLLRPLQVFYFHLRHIYWLSLLVLQYSIIEYTKRVPDDGPVWPKHVVEFAWKHGLSGDWTSDLWRRLYSINWMLQASVFFQKYPVSLFCVLILFCFVLFIFAYAHLLSMFRKVAALSRKRSRFGWSAGWV